MILLKYGKKDSRYSEIGKEKDNVVLVKFGLGAVVMECTYMNLIEKGQYIVIFSSFICNE